MITSKQASERKTKTETLKMQRQQFVSYMSVITSVYFHSIQLSLNWLSFQTPQNAGNQLDIIAPPEK